jgi:hypothetical protein
MTRARYEAPRLETTPARASSVTRTSPRASSIARASHRGKTLRWIGVVSRAGNYTAMQAMRRHCRGVLSLKKALPLLCHLVILTLFI